MGGSSSGRWWRWDARNTVQEYRCLDVRQMHKAGVLRPGVGTGWAWWNANGEQTSSITLRAEHDRIVLSYRWKRTSEESQDVQEAVSLTWSACNLGGRRPWFICPGVVNGVACGRRVAKLYCAGRYFLCRHCYHLAYQSQRESRMDRLREKAQDIRMRLGGSASLIDPFPTKPKGMHWQTYERLRRKSDEYEHRSWVAVGQWLQRFH